jgi:hypothetical protein
MLIYLLCFVLRMKTVNSYQRELQALGIKICLGPLKSPLDNHVFSFPKFTSLVARN